MTITEMFLTPNKYSRPCTKLNKVTEIFVHYVGNPNTSALANRNYFENQKNGGRYVSSHFVVGLKGEILQCVPLNEVAYCSNQANSYSISIETCHPKSDGVFNNYTYISLCELCAMLLKKYNLTINDLRRHYDIVREDGTRKQCPLHWVPTKYQSEAVATARWNRFKQDVQTVMNGGKVTRNNTVDITEASIKKSSATPSSASAKPTTFKPYLVRVIDPELNIRAEAGTQNKIVGVIKNKGVYTIVEEKMAGNVKWGLLKGYSKYRNGWISLGEKYVKKI